MSLTTRTRRTLRVTIGLAVGLVVGVTAAPRPRSRDERGLSQSTENAILLAGAVVVAGIVITLITAYVQGKLSALK